MSNASDTHLCTTLCHNSPCGELWHKVVHKCVSLALLLFYFFMKIKLISDPSNPTIESTMDTHNSPTVKIFDL